jgi:hypothetical protein
MDHTFSGSTMKNIKREVVVKKIKRQKNIITFGEVLKYRLTHPRFLTPEVDLRAEEHRYDIMPHRQLREK